MARQRTRLQPVLRSLLNDRGLRAIEQPVALFYGWNMDRRKKITETGAIETSEFDADTGLMHVSKTYDVTDVLEDNKQARLDCPETMKYKGKDFAHVMRIDGDDVSRLIQLGYNLLSHDPDEAKRALLYLQNEEKFHLRVTGKPIAKKTQLWH